MFVMCVGVDINVTLRLFRDHQHCDISQLLPQMNTELSPRSNLNLPVNNYITNYRELIYRTMQGNIGSKCIEAFKL